MSSSRERLRARRRSPWRIVAIVVASLLVVLAAGAGIALWLLPPVLAETPRERFAAPARVAVSDARGTATLEFGAGWLGIGVGPFLPADRAVVVSPDDVYRAELSLAPAGPFDGDAVLRGLELVSDPDAAAPDAAAAPSTSGAASPAPGDAPAPGSDVTPVMWSTETLATGVVVHHTELDRGDDTIVVAVAEPAVPVPGAGAGLVLTVALPSGEAPAYRTVTADLLATAAFAAPATGYPTTGHPASGSAASGSAGALGEPTGRSTVVDGLRAWEGGAS